MKKKFSVLALALCAISGTAWGQQLPNADFEGTWSACKPWTGCKYTKEMNQQPESWTISNVAGVTYAKVGSPTYLGATNVGEPLEPGYGGTGKAVKIYNSPNSVSSSKIVPGYITLGTTWSTAKGTNGGDADGGTWGGISFTYKPDALRFVYKRSVGETNTRSSIIAYLWSGSTSQASVPCNIGLLGTNTFTMENRERNILQKSTDQGGTVTNNSKLIASIEEYTTESPDEWTEMEIPFTYNEENKNLTPEMFNVIFAASDYFNSTVTKGITMCIDNVELVYYNTLSSLVFDGKAVDGFAENTLAYTIKGAEAAKDKIAATAKSQFASVETTVESAHKATVKVTANDKSTTTYTLTFIPYEYTLVDGKLTVTGTVYDEDVATLAAVVKDNNVSSVDLKSATIKASDISALTGALKSNVPVYVPSGCTAKGTDNAVKGTTASNYILTDASGDAHPSLYIPEDFVAEKITYSREFTIGNNYVSTFILPFGFAVPQGVTIAQLSRVDGGMLYFTEVQQTEANKPYVVITDTKNFVNDLTNVQVKKTVGADLTTQVDGVKHIGSYTEQTVSGVYGYANGKFVKATSGTVYPFRTYIQLTEGAAAPKAFGLAIENPTTGITRVVSQSTDAEAPVYNLQGIRQNSTNLPKGVYIVNGKKIIK